MKFLFVLVGLVGLSLADLTEDLQEFTDLIPIEKMRKLTSNQLQNDPHYISVVAYLHGPDWAKRQAELGAKPALKKFFAYMLKAGIDLKAIFAKAAVGKGMGSKLMNFLDKVISMIPKLKSSSEFQKFLEVLTSEDAQILFEELRDIPEDKPLDDKLAE